MLKKINRKGQNLYLGLGAEVQEVQFENNQCLKNKKKETKALLRARSRGQKDKKNDTIKKS